MKPLDELTSHCIRCGFCLESCPTFVVTGEETESPRGRIYLARSADEGKLDWLEAKKHLDQCLGCRACETACPSGVEYGKILEIARDRIEAKQPARTKHALLTGMTKPNLLKLQLTLGRLIPGKKIPRLLSKLLSGQEPEADRPQAQHAALPTWDQTNLPEIKGEVYLLEGCAMRVLYPRVHAATCRLLRRVGYKVRETSQGCCGALHAHNGYLEDARTLAKKLTAAMPGDLPIIVNSAGCGSNMKDYETLIGDESFAKRILDITEFLAQEGLVQTLKASKGIEETVTYHDACHLAHGQKVRSAPRDLIQAIPHLQLKELDEADMCCGSAGIYNLTEPEMARTLLERKYKNIEATGATIVVTGNPGCHAWIAQAAREHGKHVAVLHTAELLEASFTGLPIGQDDHTWVR